MTTETADSPVFYAGTDLPVPVPVAPPYQAASFGRWRLRQLPDTYIAGYFSTLSFSARNFSLEQRHVSLKNKWKTWMSITPMELESHIIPCDAATGYTVIAGLGMGLALYNICRKPEVIKVTVLEKDPQVIELFQRFAHSETWEGIEKVEILNVDALNWQPSSPVQFLYADIWEHVGSRFALPFTKRMCHLIQPKKVAYWTQEFDFIEYCQTRYPKDNWSPQMFPGFLDTIQIPLVATEYRDYPHLAVQTVRRQILEGPQRVTP